MGSMPSWTSCARLRATARIGSRELQEREIASTGIKSLKVRFNSVFGYFIEITKSNLGERARRITPASRRPSAASVSSRPS